MRNNDCKHLHEGKIILLVLSCTLLQIQHGFMHGTLHSPVLLWSSQQLGWHVARAGFVLRSSAGAPSYEKPNKASEVMTLACSGPRYYFERHLNSAYVLCMPTRGGRVLAAMPSNLTM